MKIFYRRPLSLILCIMLGGFSLFSFSSGKIKYLLFIIPLALIPLCFIPKPSFRKQRRLFLISIIALTISLILSHTYFDRYYKAYERFDDEVKVQGTVTEIQKSQYYSNITLRTTDVGGKYFSKYKILIILENDTAEEIEENTVISFSAKLCSFDSENSDFNSRSYYFARGYSAKVTEIKNYEFIKETNPTIESKIYNLRHKTSEFIVSVGGKDAGGLLAALLLGEHKYLDGQMSLDFKRIGITHMLALSGLNLMILVFGLNKLLSLFGFGKKSKYFLDIFISFAYIVFTGLSLSVVRAGFMLIITYSLFLFAKAKDSMTSLFLSVFLICLINPFSVFDIGLWLSAFATLGILTLSEIPKLPLKANKKFAVKLLSGIKSSLLISVFALSATFAISLFTFSEISVFSPISTLIFSIIMEIFMYVGTIAIFFHRLTFISQILTFIARIIKELAAAISTFEFVCVSSDFIILKILTTIFTVMFFSFLVLNIKRKSVAIYSITGFMCLILMCAALLGVNAKNNEHFYYALKENKENILINENSETTLISQSLPTPDSAVCDINIIYSEKITHIENYVLTNYSKMLPRAIEELLSSISVERIYLPEALDETERAVLKEVKSLLKNYRAKLIIYKFDEDVKIGSICFNSIYREGFEKSRLNMFSIDFKRKTYTYLSSGMLNTKTKNIAIENSVKSDALIFGRLGERYYNYQFSYEYTKAELIVFSSKNFHIPQSLLKFYEDKGAVVYTAPMRIDLYIK